jgi:hypothetical protein
VSNASTRQVQRPGTLKPNPSPRLSFDGDSPTRFDLKSRPREFSVGLATVLDDFGAAIPVTLSEIDVLELYLGDALDQFLVPHQRRSEDT